MCLAPCQQACSDARYAEEAEAVRSFLATHGESKLVQIRDARDHASERLEFESAAKLHAHLEKIEAVRALASELVRPLSELRLTVLQTSAQPGEVAVFLYRNGQWLGPAPFSTLGMRIQNEQSGSSSLYAQPMALQPVPEGGAPAATRDVLEARMEAALATLSNPLPQPSSTIRQGHLALLTRWYYRPKEKRVGEVFFAGEEGGWPLKAMLRGVGRVAASGLARASSMAQTVISPADTLKESGV